MRQYGEIPPWLSTAAAPAVSSTTGLGTGGGAAVQTKDGQGFGEVRIYVGSNPSTGGQIILTFPQTPPVLFISGDDGFGTLTVTNNDGAHTAITVAWAAKPPPNVQLRLQYEWATSK